MWQNGLSKAIYFLFNPYRIDSLRPSREVCLKRTLNECGLAGDENTILD